MLNNSFDLARGISYDRTLNNQLGGFVVEKNCLVTAQVTMQFSGPFATPVTFTAFLAKDLNKVVTFQMPSLQGACAASQYNTAQTHGALNGMDKVPAEFLPLLEHTAPIWVIKDSELQAVIGKFRVLLDGSLYIHADCKVETFFGIDPNKVNGFQSFSTQWFAKS